MQDSGAHRKIKHLRINNLMYATTGQNPDTILAIDQMHRNLDNVVHGISELDLSLAINTLIAHPIF